jgi:hypothetical protein
MGSLRHPADPAHESTVQGLASSQSASLVQHPGTPWVVQPMDGLQLSVVQEFPSLHTTAEPPAHEPLRQASPVVHALPSLHGEELLVCVQLPVFRLQRSSVHGLPSSQAADPPLVQPASWQVASHVP